MLLKAWRHSQGKRRLLLEAVAELLRARCQLKCLPFRKLALRLGAFGLESPLESEAAKSARAREVGWAIQVVAPRMRGNYTCLVRAMAARQMLARRGLPATLYLGVSRAGGALVAHAWLRCGSLCVTGEIASPHFTALASFGHTLLAESLRTDHPSILRGTHLPPPDA